MLASDNLGRLLFCPSVLLGCVGRTLGFHMQHEFQKHTETSQMPSEVLSWVGVWRLAPGWSKFILYFLSQSSGGWASVAIVRTEEAELGKGLFWV